MMKLYVNQLNLETQMVYEQQVKKQKEQMHPTDAAEVIPSSEQAEALNIPIPNTQNISSPNTQNIPESQSQEQSTPPIQAHPSQNSPSLPPPYLLPPTAPRAEQVLGEQRIEQNINANSLTMNQAIELFELLRSRRTADIVRPPTIEAQHV